MPFILSGSKFILSHNGKFTTSNRPYIEFVKGGTATGVAISFYNASLIAAYKEELEDLGLTEEQLQNSKIVNISAGTTGTVKLYIHESIVLHDGPFRLLHKLSNGTWEELWNDVVPSDGIITVTLTECSPLAGYNNDDYAADKQGVLYDSTGTDYYAMEEI